MGLTQSEIKDLAASLFDLAEDIIKQINGDQERSKKG